MINWFKRDTSKDYKGILRKAFPNALEKDLDVVFDVIPFNVNQVKLSDGTIHKVDNLIHGYFKNIKLEDEELSIPYRIYFNEPNADKEKILTESQRTILNCIYLKHHNGFIRQKRLERLEQSHQYWITPFTFQLLGEYVFEILEVLDNQLDSRRLDNYKKFAVENPKYYRQTESRMISYWNEYYRYKFPKLKLYIGKIIFDRIKAKAIGKKSTGAGL